MTYYGSPEFEQAMDTAMAVLFSAFQKVLVTDPTWEALTAALTHEELTVWLTFIGSTDKRQP